MRWAAAVMLVLCGLMAGLLYRGKLRERRNILGQVECFVRRAIGSISYEQIPPDKLICRMKCEKGSFLDHCACRIDNGDTVREAWTKALVNCRSAQYLNSDEAVLVGEIGSQLGIYDLTQQLNILERYAKDLDSACRRAQNEVREKSRTGITCSLLAGVLAALVII